MSQTSLKNASGPEGVSKPPKGARHGYKEGIFERYIASIQLQASFFDDDNEDGLGGLATI
jgi:hypothetical protein